MKQLIALLFLVPAFSSIAQTLSQYEDLVDTANGYSRLSYVVNNEFGRLANSQNNGSIGNNLGLATGSNTITFEYNSSVKKDARIWGIRVAGGAKDGIVNIVSDSKFNSGVSVSGKLHQFLPKRKIEIRSDEFDKIRRKDLELRHKYTSDSITFEQGLKTFLKDSIAKKKKLDELLKLEDDIQYAKKSGFLDLEKKKNLAAKMDLLQLKKDLILEKLEHFEEYRDSLIVELRTKRDASTNKDPFRDTQFKYDSLDMTMQMYSLKQDSIKVSKEIKAVKDLISANTYTADKESSIKSKIDLAEVEYNLSSYKIRTYRAERKSLRNQLHNDMIGSRKKNFKKMRDIRATDIMLNWLTFEVGASYDDYSFLEFSDPSTFEITKKSDLMPKVGVTYTFYQNSARPDKRYSDARNIRYFTVSLNYKWGNNVESLSQREVVTIDTINSSSYFTKSQKAYAGDLNRKVNSLNLAVDFYQFIGSKDNFGFHLKGLATGGKHYPIYSARFGLLFAALKKADNSTVLNFEVFFGLNDVLNIGRENSILERNVFGIQTSIPFNFKIKEK